MVSKITLWVSKDYELDRATVMIIGIKIQIKYSYMNSIVYVKVRTRSVNRDLHDVFRVACGVLSWFEQRSNSCWFLYYSYLNKIYCNKREITQIRLKISSIENIFLNSSIQNDNTNLFCSLSYDQFPNFNTRFHRSNSPHISNASRQHT